MEFSGKNLWAIILGGSSGLGLATAHKLAQHGLNIYIVHRDRKSALPEIEAEVAKIKANGVACFRFNVDALKAEKRGHVLEELQQQMGNAGKVRVLVHSIAKGNLKAMVEEDAATLGNDDFHITLDAMAISLYNWVKAVFDQKLFAPDARIISFTSEGSSKAWQHYAAVSAAKAALEAITRNIALEFAPHGIRANCIQAGVTETPSFKMIPGHEELKKHSLLRNPFGRLTKPEDVADVVYLLSKDESAWINGAVIPVDGGEGIR